MKSLINLIQKSNKKIIGMMSGTSCDGIDLVLLQVSGAGLKTRFEILQRFNKSYSARQKKYLLELTNPETSDVKKIRFYNKN